MSEPNRNQARFKDDQVRQEIVLADRRAADGTEKVFAVAAPIQTRLRWQVSQQRVNIRVDARAKFGPLDRGHRRAAVAMFAAKVLDFDAAGAMLVHWLPHAAGMRRRRGDCQSYGGKSAHEHENKQQSGGQAVHGWFGAPTFPPKDRLPGGCGASL